MCRINYDNDEDIKRNKVSESSAKDSLRVREFDGSPNNRRRFCGNKSEKSRSLPKKLVGTRQVDRRKSRSLPEVRRSITEGSSDDRRKFAGNSPEEAIDAPKQSCRNCLRSNRS